MMRRGEETEAGGGVKVTEDTMLGLSSLPGEGDSNILEDWATSEGTATPEESELVQVDRGQESSGRADTSKGSDTLCKLAPE